jgi:hypothetical protein
VGIGGSNVHRKTQGHLELVARGTTATSPSQTSAKCTIRSTFDFVQPDVSGHIYPAEPVKDGTYPLLDMLTIDSDYDPTEDKSTSSPVEFVRYLRAVIDFDMCGSLGFLLSEIGLTPSVAVPHALTQYHAYIPDIPHLDTSSKFSGGDV